MPMGLIDADVLIIDQVTKLLRTDFEIHEGDQVVGQITTLGNPLARMFGGHREFLVSEPDGTQVLRLKDVMNFMSRDTYEVLDGGDRSLGTLRREFTLVHKKLSFVPADGGDPLEVRGSFFGHEYTIAVRNEAVAQISRRWAGLAQSLLGGQRYAVTFLPGAGPRLRQIILGTVVAIDLVRAKDAGSAAATSS